jgi:hypothetical protein
MVMPVCNKHLFSREGK